MIPHNFFTWYETTGNAKKDKVYFDAETGVYPMATDLVDYEDGSRKVDMNTYRDYAWNDEKKKYIGTGYIDTFRYYTFPNGEVLNT